jgi:hypothetical protein
MNSQKLQLIPVLGGLLALQLLLALALNLGDNDSTGIQDQSALIPDAAAIDRIHIEDAANNAVTLQKNGEQQWQVAEKSFPVDDERIKELLKFLSEAHSGWPAGTTDDAAERFKVAPEAFERKLVLYKGEESIAELFVGTAAAFRKSHVRLGGDNEIHVGEVNTYEIYSTSDEWVDKGILRQDTSKITAVRLPGLTLERNEQGLNINGLKNSQQTNVEQAEALLQKIAQLRIQEVLGTEAKPAYRQNKPSHTIGLTLEDGTSIDYTISLPEDTSHYILKSSTRPEYFKVPTYTLDPIFDTKREQLVEAKKPQAEENKAS